MDECRKALEKVERLACEALANPSDNDSETLVAICTTVEEALATRTEAKVSGEVVPREVLFPVFKSLVDKWVEKRDEPHEILSKRLEDRLANFLADNFQLPAPQSPVVPGVDSGSGPRFIRGAIADLKEALLIEDARHFEKCIRSALARLSDDSVAHLLANAREIREGVRAAAIALRAAIEFAKESDWTPDMLTMQRWEEALATVGKDG